MVKHSTRAFIENETRRDSVEDTSNSRTSQPSELDNIALKLRILQNALFEYQAAGGSVKIKNLDRLDGAAILLEGVQFEGSKLVVAHRPVL
jgi:hypothetical protein